MDERLESVLAERLEKKHLRLAAGIAGAEQARAQHTRGVDRDGVARGDKLDDVGEAAVLDRTARSIHDHEPTLVPPIGRHLRDAVRRQSEVVVGGARTDGRGTTGDEEYHPR